MSFSLDASQITRFKEAIAAVFEISFQQQTKCKWQEVAIIKKTVVSIWKNSRDTGAKIVIQGEPTKLIDDILHEIMRASL